jgi:hypothetical protein
VLGAARPKTYGSEPRLPVIFKPGRRGIASTTAAVNPESRGQNDFTVPGKGTTHNSNRRLLKPLVLHFGPCAA